MKRRAFLGLGATSIGVGALYSTGAFSSVNAGRSVAVSAADGLGALLGIESEGDVGEIRGDDDPVTVGTLLNNVNESVTVEDIVVESIGGEDVSDDILAVADPSPGDEIGSGSESDVTVECADDESVGEQEVVIRIVGVSGDTVRIAEPTFSVTVNIQCGQGQFSGSAQFTAGDVAVDDTTQRISFDVEALGNNDEVTVNFSNPQDNDGVDYSNVTNGDINIVDGSGTATFDSDVPELVYDLQGNEKGTVTIDINNIDVIGESGDSYLIEYSDTDGRDDGDFFEIQ